MVPITETPEYEEWLLNFPTQYHPAAALLVGALQYIDESTFRSELTSRILDDLATGEITRPALVVPARTGPEMNYQGKERATVFKNVWPREGLSVSNTGSEALCANIIRNLSRRREGALGVIPVPRSLDSLRMQKPRSIVLVSDYAGSGSQVIEAAKVWTRNASIRSWRSYGLIRLHVVLHSASATAKAAIEKSASIDSCSIISIAPDFDTADWTPEEREDVEVLCAKFSRGHDSNGLGWDDSAGLLVMQHTIPNNLPEILWQTKSGMTRRRDGWYALLPNRRLPNQIADALALQRATRRNLAGSARRGLAQIHGSALSSVLYALGQGMRTPEQISAASEVSLADSKRVFSELEVGGYVDRRGYLTDQGRRLASSEGRPMRRYQLKGSDRRYYPQSLRRVGDV